MEQRNGGTVVQGASVTRRSSTFTSMLRWSETVDTWLNYMGMVFIILLMLLTLINVAGRLLFNWPFKGYIDAQEMMMALLVFLSLAYCQLKNGNIRFELFMTKFLKGGRTYHMVEVFYLLIALTGFVMIAVYSLQTAIYSLVIQDVTLSVHWPIWPARLGTAIGSILLCIRLLIQITQNATWAVVGIRHAPESAAGMK
ncbi:TRAP transporter small permease [Chloroflexota bacterium]